MDGGGGEGIGVEGRGGIVGERIARILIAGTIIPREMTCIINESGFDLLNQPSPCAWEDGENDEIWVKRIVFSGGNACTFRRSKHTFN